MRANGCSLPDQTPTSRNSWAVRGADKNVIVEIPYRCLTGAGSVEQVVRVAVPVKIGCSHRRPARWNGRPKSAAEECSSRQMPDRCLAITGIEQGIVCMAVAIEVRHTGQSPASRKSRAIGGADENVVIKIP